MNSFWVIFKTNLDTALESTLKETNKNLPTVL